MTAGVSETCRQMVGHPYPSECGKPAKYIVTYNGIGTRPIPVCGVHVKWYQRNPTRWNVEAR